MGNMILSKSREESLMRTQAARDKERRTLDSDKSKAPVSSAGRSERMRRNCRQTEQGNIPQQEDTVQRKRVIDGETTRTTLNHQK
jgi:hypothetical protein